MAVGSTGEVYKLCELIRLFRSAILNDVATSSARNRTQVTKTLLVLGKNHKKVVNIGQFNVCDKR